MDSPPENVHLEKKWTSLQADGDNLTKVMFLKGRISTSLEALTEALPKFAEKGPGHRPAEKRQGPVEV